MKFYFRKKNGNFFDLFDNLNSNISIKIDTAYLSNEDYLTSLNTNLIIKNNQIFDLNLYLNFLIMRSLRSQLKQIKIKKRSQQFLQIMLSHW